MSNFRHRILEPLLFPVSAFVFVGGLAWGLSRILLATTADGAVGIALFAALFILTACSVIAAKGFHLPQRAATMSAYVMLVAGGSVFAATAGIRPVEHHLPEPSFTITASNAQRFDQNHIRLDEKEEQVVRFINKDPAAPHNWGVLRTKEFSADAAALLVDPGAPLDNGQSRDYLLEESKIGPGSYFYFCFVHPNMTGQLDIGEGGGSPPPPPTKKPTAPPPTGPVSTAITLVATNFEFDLTQFRLAAGKKVEITLDNRDPEVPHNVSIYRDETFAEPVFIGEDEVTGPDRGIYSFTAPPPGTYHFKCDFHPAMKGTAVFV